MTQILQNHTNKVFLNDISQVYSIRGAKNETKYIFTCIVFIQGHVTEKILFRVFLLKSILFQYFYLKALSTKNNVANNQNVLILSRKEK